MLPDRYPDPQHLPFNRLAMEGLELEPPDADPGGDGVWLALQGTRVLALATPDGPALPQGAPLPMLSAQGDRALFFGRRRGTPCRVLPLPGDFVPPAGYTLENLLAPQPVLGLGDLSLAGLASQVLHWERQSRHCGGCGEPCAFLPGEWGRHCPACGMRRYPAVHPCVIVLISRPGEVLLVRKPEWAEGRYSLVAGFVEIGESLEDCVVREVAEEVGVTVKNLRYLGSQSWPFPSQLMAGYHAEYAGGELRLDTTELDDGRWFPLGELPQLPPTRSIARWLIDRWVTSETGGEK